MENIPAKMNRLENNRTFEFIKAFEKNFQTRIILNLIGIFSRINVNCLLQAKKENKLGNFPGKNTHTHTHRQNIKQIHNNSSTDWGKKLKQHSTKKNFFKI